MTEEAFDLILENVQQKITSKHPLTEVEKIVWRQYLSLCKKKVDDLERKSKNIPLSEPEVMRLNHYRAEILKFGG